MDERPLKERDKEFLEQLPAWIRGTERRIKKRKVRPSGLRKREAQDREMLDQEVRLLEALRARQRRANAKDS